jgi:hypothetical protein
VEVKWELKVVMESRVGIDVGLGMMKRRSWCCYMIEGGNLWR